MVYDGRPSRGCQTCRTRRVKCDTTRPVCGQCTKSRRKCLGYRDDSDVYFRNENHVTALRVKRSENRKSALEKQENLSNQSSSDGGSPASDSLDLALKARREAGVPPLMSIRTDVMAINGFFQNFILAPRHPKCSPGHLQYLPSLYRNAAEDSAMNLSVAAMSLAARSLFMGYHREYTELAWQAYGKAIQKLKEAIQDPLKARQNGTLMAIMVIGSTECLLATPAPKYARSGHLDGAVALLKLRGEELIKDEVSTSLYLNVRTHMLLDRIQTGRSADTIFHDKTSGWKPQLTGRIGVNTKLTQYAILMPALRTRAHQITKQPLDPSSIEEATEFIRECQSFDTVLASWPATIPEDWQYFTVIGPETDYAKDDYEHSELYPGNIDLYYDGWVACVWNAWRCTRMFVNALILRCVTYITATGADVGEDPAYVIAKDTLQKMANEVCSSVPFHIGYEPPASAKKDSDSGEQFPGLKCLEPTALSAYFLLWPLFVARSALTVPSRQRAWLRGRMMAILMRFGTIHAKWLVEIGDKDEKRPLFAENWEESNFENVIESSYLYASGGV